MQTVTVADSSWERRFRASRHTIPAWAKRDHERCAFTSNATGTIEVYAWDRRAATVRQVTDRSHGTFHCAIDAPGAHVWWFGDDEGDEFGRWMRQPFAGGPDAPAAPALAPGWPAGLALGYDGNVLVGLASEDEGSTVHLVAPDGSARLLYRNEQSAYAIDVAPDSSLIAIAHTEHGDAHFAPRILAADGSTVLDLPAADDGCRLVGFAPRGAAAVLGVRDADGAQQPFVLDVRSGERFDLPLALPGELEPSWFPDASAILILQRHHARSRLYRYHLHERRLEPVPTAAGTVEAARPRPDGSVWFLWSSAAQPPQFLTTTGDPGLSLPGESAPASVPLADVFVPGPGGPVHALVSRPAGADAPGPAVVLLHGGPDDHDVDGFEPEAAAWVDHGFTVIRVNYRGSSGYGTSWTEAIYGRPGMTELEDVAAVRDWAVETGIADPSRLVLAGSSWGGYLALLGLGTQPDAWALAVADAPIADYVAEYEDTMEEIRGTDRVLFGGSPDEVPEAYRTASPISYVAAIRGAAFVSAGLSDARCPTRQVANYVAALEAHGVAHEVWYYDAGHHAGQIDQRIALVRRQLAFVQARLAE